MGTEKEFVQSISATCDPELATVETRVAAPVADAVEDDEDEAFGDFVGPSSGAAPPRIFDALATAAVADPFGNFVGRTADEKAQRPEGKNSRNVPKFEMEFTKENNAR